MGKMPVIGLAGALLAGIALSGCQKAQQCNNGTCGANGHMAAGQAWQTQPVRTTGQPGGIPASATTMPTTVQNGSHSTQGFHTVGQQPITSQGAIGGQPITTTTTTTTPTFHRPIGTTMGTSTQPTIQTGRPIMPVQEMPVRPATGLSPSSSAPIHSIPPSQGLPTGSTTSPVREMPPVGSSTGLPPGPTPVESSSSTPVMTPPAPSSVTAPPPPPAPVGNPPALELPPPSPPQ